MLPLSSLDCVWCLSCVAVNTGQEPLLNRSPSSPAGQFFLEQTMKLRPTASLTSLRTFLRPKRKKLSFLFYFSNPSFNFILLSQTHFPGTNLSKFYRLMGLKLRRMLFKFAC